MTASVIVGIIDHVEASVRFEDPTSASPLQAAPGCQSAPIRYHKDQ